MCFSCTVAGILCSAPSEKRIAVPESTGESVVLRGADTVVLGSASDDLIWFCFDWTLDPRHCLTHPLLSSSTLQHAHSRMNCK